MAGRITWNVRAFFGGARPFNLTPYVLEMSWSVGGQRPAGTGGLLDIAVGSVLLDNQGGEFDIWNPAEGVSVDAGPMVEIYAAVPGLASNLRFRGWSAGISNQQPEFDFGYALLPLDGRISRVARYSDDVFQRVSGLVTSDKLITALCEEAGIPASARTIFPGDTTLNGLKLSEAGILSSGSQRASFTQGVDVVAKAELGVVYDDHRGNLVFENRNFRPSRMAEIEMLEEQEIPTSLHKTIAPGFSLARSASRDTPGKFVVNEVLSQQDAYTNAGTRASIEVEGGLPQAVEIPANSVGEGIILRAAFAQIGRQGPAIIQDWVAPVRGTHYTYTGTETPQIDYGEGFIRFVVDNGSNEPQTLTVTRLLGNVFYRKGGVAIAQRRPDSIDLYGGVSSVAYPGDLVADLPSVRAVVKEVLDVHDGVVYVDDDDDDTTPNVPVKSTIPRVSLTMDLGEAETDEFLMGAAISDLVNVSLVGLGVLEPPPPPEPPAPPGPNIREFVLTVGTGFGGVFGYAGDGPFGAMDSTTFTEAGEDRTILAILYFPTERRIDLVYVDSATNQGRPTPDSITIGATTYSDLVVNNANGHIEARGVDNPFPPVGQTVDIVLTFPGTLDPGPMPEPEPPPTTVEMWLDGMEYVVTEGGDRVALNLDLIGTQAFRRLVTPHVPPGGDPQHAPTVVVTLEVGHDRVLQLGNGIDVHCVASDPDEGHAVNLTYEWSVSPPFGFFDAIQQPNTRYRFERTDAAGAALNVPQADVDVIITCRVTDPSGAVGQASEMVRLDIRDADYWGHLIDITGALVIDFTADNTVASNTGAALSPKPGTGAPAEQAITPMRTQPRGANIGVVHRQFPADMFTNPAIPEIAAVVFSLQEGRHRFPDWEWDYAEVGLGGGGQRWKTWWDAVPARERANWRLYVIDTLTGEYVELGLTRTVGTVNRVGLFVGDAYVAARAGRAAGPRLANLSESYPFTSRRGLSVFATRGTDVYAWLTARRGRRTIVALVPQTGYIPYVVPLTEYEFTISVAGFAFTGFSAWGFATGDHGSINPNFYDRGEGRYQIFRFRSLFSSNTRVIDIGMGVGTEAGDFPTYVKVAGTRFDIPAGVTDNNNIRIPITEANDPITAAMNGQNIQVAIGFAGQGGDDE